ncbi:MAG: aminotransferase class V-fold PLP-dependent enzyme [Chitinophagaceae bacterium]|nr:aminotransferase class V-fold PLP-dependent enzyme [Chitinophagaceae bacterium]
MVMETTKVAVDYFESFRKNIVGHDLRFNTPYGAQNMIYADWIASGRLYKPIEEKMLRDFGPLVGNTHTETNITGTSMTLAYKEAKHIIRQHVHATDNDVLLMVGSGMTGALAKLQRLLGLKVPEWLQPLPQMPESLRPVVFITHMEHHSNQIAWEESIATVEIIQPDKDGLVDLGSLDFLLEKYRDRKFKFASVTSCSNVTGIFSPYFEIAERMHRSGGSCFVDFACSAPYAEINMHPENPLQKLDAIFFSPHKFLGGPGSPGVLIFDAQFYQNKVPDQPGGGTVTWTNPWGEHHYLPSIEEREDGGTPAFLQTIRAALAIKLKEQMGVQQIMQREEEMVKKVFYALKQIQGLHILASDVAKRVGVISFYIDGLHYNLGVKLLNDRFGIQVRGGCSCAGTYGHYLLHVSPDYSHRITEKIDQGDFSEKPGWIRLSLHPVMREEEVDHIIFAIESLAKNFVAWSADYDYNVHTNEFHYRDEDPEKHRGEIVALFDL